VLGEPNCASQITGGSNPSYTLILEPNWTLQLTPQIGGVSCIAAEGTTVQTGSVSILVNGYTQVTTWRKLLPLRLNAMAVAV
jgi:hypothetical protein